MKKFLILCSIVIAGCGGGDWGPDPVAEKQQPALQPSDAAPVVVVVESPQS